MTSLSLAVELEGAAAGGAWPTGACAVAAPLGGRSNRLRTAALKLLLGKLFLDFNSAPKRHVILHVAGCRLGIRVVPGGVLILLPIDQKAVVSRLSLPGAGGNR